ncbi:MAG TPA: TonB family protein [Firmicutes bacterium]|nr:TonB family protein [Bacillota bacterium]
MERSRPLTPTQPDPPEVQESPVEEQPPLFGEGELMTSETGPELAIDEEDKEIEAAEDSGTPASQADTTGSGEGTQGEADAPGLAQSGEGEAESAPPAPAPLPGGFSLYPGGGNPIYPKDAAHEGKEGTVITTVRVTASGQLQEVITTQSSGHEDLDAQAKYEAEMAPWPEHDFDYEVEVKHTYTREEFVPSVSYGLMKPQDAP